ncbi:uncharacterized protein TRIADDRAFT_62893, partial [Trichoplax adhaerens]
MSQPSFLGRVIPDNVARVIVAVILTVIAWDAANFGLYWVYKLEVYLIFGTVLTVMVLAIFVFLRTTHDCERFMEGDKNEDEDEDEDEESEITWGIAVGCYVIIVILIIVFPKFRFTRCHLRNATIQNFSNHIISSHALKWINSSCPPLFLDNTYDRYVNVTDNVYN